jgi:hypothetical protein
MLASLPMRPPNLRRNVDVMRPALLLATAALLLGAVGCQSGNPVSPYRSSKVAPVPIDRGVDRQALPERLTRWIDGSQAWAGDKRAGTWKASYNGGDTIIAELDWDRFYLRTEVKVKDDEIEIQVDESEGLGQQGNQIHERALLHLASLRRTIRTALRSDTDRGSKQASPPSERAEPEPYARTRPAPADFPDGSDARAAVSPEALGRYYALVIGNDVYADLPRLRTAVADARVVASLLEDDYGFTVTRLENADRTKIVSALNGYRSTLGAGDNLLIFYAGHGWFDEEAQQGYWLPVDAVLGDPTNWVSNATITDMLRAIPARHVLIVADSCYSGTLTRGVRAKSSDRALTRLAEKRSRTALTSGGLEPVEDGRGEHSVFAMAFTDALRRNDQILDAHSLFIAMRRPVMLEADQTPEYSDIRRAGHDGGDFLFAPQR